MATAVRGAILIRNRPTTRVCIQFKSTHIVVIDRGKLSQLITLCRIQVKVACQSPED